MCRRRRPNERDTRRDNNRCLHRLLPDPFFVV
jgi:hypothetical protein